MADETKQYLVYVSRLSASEKAQVYDLAHVWPDADLRGRLYRAVEDVCLDRLIRAEGCLEVAQSLAKLSNASGVEELRAAISRAYYSIHHALRAMCLHQNHWDPDGHGESIEQFRKLVSEAEFQRACGLMPEIVREIGRARDNREVADYSPYDVSRKTGDVGLFAITESSWPKAAEFNIRLAEKVLAAAKRLIFT